MAERHQALTQSIANSYLEAARVCLDRHHISPKEFTLENDIVESIARVEWEATKAEVKKRLNSKIKQTREGNSNLPALVSIVGFKIQLVLLHTVDETS